MVCRAQHSYVVKIEYREESKLRLCCIKYRISLVARGDEQGVIYTTITSQMHALYMCIKNNIHNHNETNSKTEMVER